MTFNSFKSLTNKGLEVALKKYYKNDNIEVLDFDAEPLEIKTRDGKIKEFYNIIVMEKEKCFNMILKIIPNVDEINLMAAHNYYREVAFFGTDLYYNIDEIIKIPIVEVCNNIELDERWILMDNVSEELKKFGPPKLPTDDVVKNIIHKLGKFHSLTWGKNDLDSKYPWLMNFEVWLKTGVSLLKSIIDNNLDDEIVKSYLKDKPELFLALPKFLEGLTDLKKEALKEFICNQEKMINYVTLCPKAVCHNDLHFSNIGILDSSLLLIDWEFVGVAPTAWDMFSFYGGIPNPKIPEEKAFEIYFSSLKECGIDVDRDLWIKIYRSLNLVETIISVLRDMIPIAFDENINVSDKYKSLVERELNALLDRV